MKIDEQSIRKLAKDLGMESRPTQKAVADVDLKQFENMSDDRLVKEILKVKDQLTKEKVPKEQQLKAVRELLPMMNEQQKTRLTQLIGLISKE